MNPFGDIYYGGPPQMQSNQYGGQASYQGGYSPQNGNLPAYQTSVYRTGLAGRIVNDISEVTTNEIPQNGAPAIFPNKDGTKITVRNFGGDGLIHDSVYVLQSDEKGQDPIIQSLDAIFEKLERMENKIYSLTKYSNNRNYQGRKFDQTEEPTIKIKEASLV